MSLQLQQIEFMMTECVCLSVTMTVWSVVYSGGLQGRPSSSDMVPASSVLFTHIREGGEPSLMACFSCSCRKRTHTHRHTQTQRRVWVCVWVSQKLKQFCYQCFPVTVTHTFIYSCVNIKQYRFFLDRGWHTKSLIKKTDDTLTFCHFKCLYSC